MSQAYMASATAGGFCFAIFQGLGLVCRGYGLLGVCFCWRLCWRHRFAYSGPVSGSSRVAVRVPCLLLARLTGSCWLAALRRPALALGARSESPADFGPHIGPSLCHSCAVLRLCSGPALTTRGRHTRRLVCPTWARGRVGDRPVLGWTHDLRLLGPYSAPGQDRAHFCAGPGSPCFALTLRWAWALGLMHLPGSLTPGPFLASRPLSALDALSLCSRPRSPSLAPFASGRVLPAPGLRRPRTGPSFVAHPFPGARVVSVAWPTLALRVLGSRVCVGRVGPGVLCLTKAQTAATLRLCSAKAIWAARGCKCLVLRDS